MGIRAYRLSVGNTKNRVVELVEKCGCFVRDQKIEIGAMQQEFKLKCETPDREEFWINAISQQDDQFWITVVTASTSIASWWRKRSAAIDKIEDALYMEEQADTRRKNEGGEDKSK